MVRFPMRLALGALLCVCGCNFLTSLNNPPPTINGNGTSGLKAFSSAADLRDYFTGQINQRNGSLSAPADGSASGSANGGAGGPNPGTPPIADHGSSEGAANLTDGAGGGYSGTTIQEAGVDESDFVKTDGTNIYVIATKNNSSILRIVQASPLQLLSETALEGYGSDIYVHNNKVVAITSGGGFYFPMGGGGIAMMDSTTSATGMPRDDSSNSGSGGSTTSSSSSGTVVAVPTDGSSTPPDATNGGSADGSALSDSGSGGSDGGISTTIEPIGGIAPFPGIYQRPFTVVTVVDVSNPASPAVLSTTHFDGNQAATRMIDGVLHIVLANYQMYFFDVMPMLGQPQLDLSSISSDTLLPTYTRINPDGSKSSGNVLTWDQLYRPVEPDGFGVVAVVSVDVDNDAQFSATGIVSEPGLVYSSADALYLTNTQWDFQGRSRATTNIYKFVYANRGAQATATGTINGRVLNQYSMSEKDGNLRVATTTDGTWTCDMFGCSQTELGKNSVYVVSQSQDALNVIGSLEDIAPGETIQAARFIGDRGFVVTYKQMDPLFTLDVSDPANPRLVGQLVVPGYSTFLVPMDENHLLAIGQYVPAPPAVGNWGVQLSIYDITDFGNPVQTSNVVYGADTGAYSEALWNQKALTYFAERGRVAIPLSIYGQPIPIDSGTTSGDGGTIQPSVKAQLDNTTTSTSTGGATTVSTGDTPSGEVTDTSAPVDIAVDPGIYDPFANGGFDGLLVLSATVNGGIVELGRIDTRFSEAAYWYPSFTRGVFIGDDVHAITELGDHTAAISDLSTPTGELFFGLPYDDSGTPIPIDGGVSTGTGSGSAGSTGTVTSPPASGTGGTSSGGSSSGE
ncbi:MAG: beta-propeller domain-containing protein [Planctomycetes bacterium]|nr:beta-propeller domain-containing protein [Planctomycetota bacterium]MBI3836159.1 beta-propeller domain-containing protein [Planctomycetota bacterium]